MKFSVLPTVLQDIVMLFCYNMPVHMVRANVNELLSIKSMGLPFILYREKVWSWKFTRFLPKGRSGSDLPGFCPGSGIE